MLKEVGYVIILGLVFICFMPWWPFDLIFLIGLFFFLVVGFLYLEREQKKEERIKRLEKELEKQRSEKSSNHA